MAREADTAQEFPPARPWLLSRALWLLACAILPRTIGRFVDRIPWAKYMHTFAALVLALTLGQDASLSTNDVAAEQAIRTIVAGQAGAWNAGDAKGYAREVAPDVSFTNLFGMVMYGHDAFERRHAEILTTFYKGTVKSHVVRRIRFVTVDVAIVDIDNEVRGVRSLPSGLAVPKDGVVKTRLMEVFVRRNGRWWVEAYHNVDVKSAQ
jgi:uncharacterized protein (TIGR02246 family)